MILKNPEQTISQKKSEQGSVLFYILIAVILFAALGAAVSSMMRGPLSGSIGKEKQGIYVTEILSYAQQISNAVRDLRISNDCEDTDISFENGFITGYEHTPAARDECKVFHPGGAGVAYVDPQADWLDHTQMSNAGYGEYYFSGKPAAIGVGSTKKDIILFLNYVKTDICLKINDQAGVTNPGNEPPIDVGAIDSFHKFEGTFDSGSALNPPQTEGFSFGCFQNSGQNRNIFYYVVLAR